MLSIKLFGMVKTLAQQQKELSIEFADGLTVKDLIEILQAKYPEIGDLVSKKKVLISVNHEISHPDTVISTADEVALLPPFAGGS
ncbi:MoaD/ThiS family protein [Candidatus Nitrospira salsa]